MPPNRQHDRSEARCPTRCKRRRSEVAWPLLLSMLLGACGAEPELLLEAPCTELRWSGEAMPFNLVLIVNDAMRRDRVGIYGGAAHTPSFDALAAEGVWFESAITQSPWTKPSIATLFTSLFPSQHGVLSDPQARDPYSETGAAPVEMQDILSEKVVTLAEVFRAAGYRTAAIVSNPWLDARFGFQQGFDSYDDTFARFDLPGTAVTENALHLLADLEEDEKFFLYLHYLDSHRPYLELTLTEIAARAEISELMSIAEITAIRRYLPPMLRSSQPQPVMLPASTCLL